MTISLVWATLVATPPQIIQGLITVWPPVTQVDAFSAWSLNPFIRRGTTISLSFWLSLLDTPSNISILSHSVTPIAYKSLNTFAHVILPWIGGKTETCCYVGNRKIMYQIFQRGLTGKLEAVVTKFNNFIITANFLMNKTSLQVWTTLNLIRFACLSC